jgi:hypothetical protein
MFEIYSKRRIFETYINLVQEKNFPAHVVTFWPLEKIISFLQNTYTKRKIFVGLPVLPQIKSYALYGNRPRPLFRSRLIFYSTTKKGKNFKWLLFPFWFMLKKNKNRTINCSKIENGCLKLILSALILLKLTGHCDFGSYNSNHYFHFQL